MAHMKAEYWRAVSGRVQCELCPRACLIADGSTGACRVRRVRDGKLVAQGYGQISSISMDPIEKKPLYHFVPGSRILSVGGWGCNLSCQFCQNWSISQKFEPGEVPQHPESVVAKAIQHGSVGLAYTYNEPIVGFEFVRDCSHLAREAGLANVLVTNGFINPEPATELLPLIDALNIDIKSMDDDFYRKYCSGRLTPVLDFAIQAREAGCHVEITNLLIPDHNDSDTDVSKLARWISNNLGANTPLHISAYTPRYRLGAAPTSEEIMNRALDLCREMLCFVYLGNNMSAQGRNTNCQQCGVELLTRNGFRSTIKGVVSGKCEACGEPVPFVM